MITVYSRGGSANQMFQLAFAIAESMRQGTWFSFRKEDMPDALQIFELKAEAPVQIRFSLWFYRLRYQMHRRLYLRIQAWLEEGYRFEEDQWQTYAEQQEAISMASVLHGYFQSMSYFQEVKNIVREVFRIREEVLNRFTHKYAELLNGSRPITVVQIRRNDYLHLGQADLGGKGLQLKDEVYEHMFELAHAIEGQQVIVIGDDEAYATMFKEKYPTMLVIDGGMEDDFLWMQHAHRLILSNSTFGWWAAFLSRHSHPEVYVPEYWLGHKVQREFPTGIFQELNWKTFQTSV